LQAIRKEMKNRTVPASRHDAESAIADAAHVVCHSLRNPQLIIGWRDELTYDPKSKD